MNSTAWLIVIYAIHILLPMIPAAILYRLFPDDEISASGVFSQLKINATGAFGAYVIILMIGGFGVFKIHDHIRNAAWEVRAKVRAVDVGGAALPMEATLDGATATLSSIRVTPVNDEVIITIPSGSLVWGRTSLMLRHPDYGIGVVYLGRESPYMDVNDSSLVVTLKKPIEMRSGVPINRFSEKKNKGEFAAKAM